jgi:hypothetical protein
MASPLVAATSFFFVTRGFESLAFPGARVPRPEPRLLYYVRVSFLYLRRWG